MTTRELIHQLVQQVWDNCAKQVTVLELLDRGSTSKNWQKKDVEALLEQLQAR